MLNSRLIQHFFPNRFNKKRYPMEFKITYRKGFDGLTTKCLPMSKIIKRIETMHKDFFFALIKTHQNYAVMEWTTGLQIGCHLNEKYLERTIKKQLNSQTETQIQAAIDDAKITLLEYDLDYPINFIHDFKIKNNA